MSDTLGNISVPDPAVSAAVFPVTTDWGYARTLAPQVAIHEMANTSANLKIEQRFLLGSGVKAFTVRCAGLSRTRYELLRAFWDSRKGAYEAFTYNAPNDDPSTGTTAYTVRFANEPISFEHLSNSLSSTGITLLEVPTSSAPTYSVNSTVERFPGSTLGAALAAQVQEIIPLVRIAARDSLYPVMYVSDRRCTVGGQLYQARLLRFDGISQGINGESDQATFILGNADRVMTLISNDVDLQHADIALSLYHVGSGIKCDLWAGRVNQWSGFEGPEFTISADDALPLTLPYPARTISRTCWKVFDSDACPYTANGTPGYSSCTKDFAACGVRGMSTYFGGVQVSPQGVNVKDNSTGTWALGRRNITSVSMVSESAEGKPLREIYTDVQIPVPCDVAAGRDESEFYDALGIIGAGPLSSFGYGHTLDGQYHHGPGNLGLRRSYGGNQVTGSDQATDNSPDPDSDKFSLGNGNPTVYGSERAAGVAFIEIRRSDEKGLQLTRLTEHAIQAMVSGGLKGYTWSAPGSRTLTSSLVNPVWIAVNAFLRAKGLWLSNATTQEAFFRVTEAVSAAAICDTTVAKMVGTGTETQFAFRGFIEEQKPLRDWLQEILATCLGYYVSCAGKLKIGSRISTSSASSYTIGNIVRDSLRLSAVTPQFNHLTATFADSEYEWKPNTVSLYDEDAMVRNGFATRGSINLVGVSGKSQAARIVTMRLREELGGVDLTEQRKAREASWRTTILGLDTEPGMVVTLAHSDVPGGSGKFRVLRWRLNGDYSIDIEAKSITDAMYNVASGPVPVDVPASPIPAEYAATPLRQAWHPGYVTPNAADPLVNPTAKTFEVGQRYETLVGDSVQAFIDVTGKMPVNSFIENVAVPVIGSVAADNGGSLDGPDGFYVAVAAQHDYSWGPLSAIMSVQIDGADQRVQFRDMVWPGGEWDDWGVFAGRTQTTMCHQPWELSHDWVELPSTFNWSAAFKESTVGVNSLFRRIRCKAKPVLHSGVIGTNISGVGATYIDCSALIDSGDDWTGRILSVIADASDGSHGLWNFLVSDYDDETGRFTVTPNPAIAGVEEGDVIVVRTLTTFHDHDAIGDSKLVNGIYPSGLETDAEVGNLIRVISGTGKGQVRRITSNSDTVYYVTPDWETEPGDDSIFIVEAPDWQYQAESAEVKNARSDVSATISVPVPNNLRQTMIVIGQAIDSTGGEAAESESPWREIFLFGEPFIKSVTDPAYAVDTNDRYIFLDPTDDNQEVTLPAAAQMKGRSVIAFRDAGGSNTAKVVATEGETINGDTEVTLSNQYDSVTLFSDGSAWSVIGGGSAGSAGNIQIEY